MFCTISSINIIEAISIENEKLSNAVFHLICSYSYFPVPPLLVSLLRTELPLVAGSPRTVECRVRDPFFFYIVVVVVIFIVVFIVIVIVVVVVVAALARWSAR